MVNSKIIVIVILLQIQVHMTKFFTAAQSFKASETKNVKLVSNYNHY